MVQDSRFLLVFGLAMLVFGFMYIDGNWFIVYVDGNWFMVYVDGNWFMVYVDGV